MIDINYIYIYHILLDNYVNKRIQLFVEFLTSKNFPNKCFIFILIASLCSIATYNSITIETNVKSDRSHKKTSNKLDATNVAKKNKNNKNNTKRTKILQNKYGKTV